MTEVVFTSSGTTGAAKRIVRSMQSLEDDAAELVRTFPEIWADRPLVVASVPEDHLYGTLWRVFAPKAAGCEVVRETVLSEEQLAAVHDRLGRFLFVTTPSFLEGLLAHPDVDELSGAFVGIVTSGGLLRKETALAAEKRLGCCPLEIFGSTETGTVAYRRQAEGELWTLVQSVNAATDEGGRLSVDSTFAVARPFVLSDAVSFVDARRFRLLGRTDRQVKILEQFVSLPEIEVVLESHPFVARARVEPFGDCVSRLGALIVLSESGLAALSAGTHDGVASTLRKDLLSNLGSIRFPRRIRFVRALPSDARGKTTSAAVRTALTRWCREPAVSEWTCTEAELTAKLIFPPDCECFKGHFPALAVLPGVAQIDFLRHFARQAFVDYPDVCAYRRLKFQKLILPGCPVWLSVRRKGPGSFAFSIKGERGVCASGLVEGGLLS